jgi:SAM-dependent methyltransferase
MRSRSRRSARLPGPLEAHSYGESAAQSASMSPVTQCLDAPADSVRCWRPRPPPGPPPSPRSRFLSSVARSCHYSYTRGTLSGSNYEQIAAWRREPALGQCCSLWLFAAVGDSREGSVMSSEQLYDTIGATYTVTRRTEPRIAAQVWAALGDARTVLNVGAGTGSYEPSDREVTAVEPSAVMRAQRPAGAARCVAATAESLPFKDQSFDAAMAFATVHHWRDPIAGLLEMRRVARRVVVFTCETTDRSWRRRFWLTRDYLPEVAASRVGLATELARAIGARMEPVLIPCDCADGFFEAYWRRPEAYLDDNVRRGISVWATVGREAEQRAVRSLRDDLATGRWAERNRDLLDLEAAELGLRLLIEGARHSLVPLRWASVRECPLTTGDAWY